MTSQEVKDKLDGVGCGFCLAKWTQVTMHLGTGMTHSCHHPAPHKIPLSEISRNPSALHNSRFKKRKRKEMLEGKRPDECNYCWKVEDSSTLFLIEYLSRQKTGHYLILKLLKIVIGEQILTQDM